MAKRKSSRRPKPAAADEPLRRGRKDDGAGPKKPDVTEELLDAVRRVARGESEILPGIPLS